MGVCLKGIRLEGTLKSCSSYGEFELWEFELWRFNCSVNEILQKIRPHLKKSLFRVDEMHFVSTLPFFA